MTLTMMGRTLARHLEEILACFALAIVVLAVCWGVVTRYITAQPANWAGEVAGMGFAWVIFVGAAAGAKRRMHVSIDMLVTALPAALGRPLQWAIDAFVIGFSLYVSYLGTVFAIENWDNPTPVLRLPMTCVYASVAVGFLLMAIRFAQAAVQRRSTVDAGAAP
jgi:TRAP-type C4-dicarboxylate transport system permease small subunit